METLTKDCILHYANKHNCDINKLIIGIMYGDLYIWRYNGTNHQEEYEVLEIIPDII